MSAAQDIGWDDDHCWEDDETLFESLEGGIALRHIFHEKQRKFTDDQSRFRVVNGGRRSGKSTIIGAEALEVADQFPGTTVPYLANTVGRARDILMPHFEKFISEHDVRLEFLRGEFKIFTPNGGCVQLGGLATISEVEKGRGGSYPALYIDEAGAIGDRLLRPTILETFGPATKDFLGKGGRGIVVGGTPDYVPNSYWYQLNGGNTGKSEFGASLHHMTIFDNPFYAGREQEVIDSYCQENKLEPTDPEVQREWLGLFCLNTSGLAYPHWDGQVLPLVQMPLGGYTVLAVDLGSDHPCAFVVVRFTMHESIIGPKGHEILHRVHHAHVLETYEESNLSVHDVRAIISQFQKNYSVSLTVGDSGGGGKMTITTINRVMGVPIQPVEKAGLKEDRIWMLDSMFRTGRMHVYDRCESLIEQLGSVPKERQTNGHLDHMRGYPDHSLDALHYALVAANQHELQLELPPLPGTKEWNKRQQAMEARIASENPAQRANRLRRVAKRARALRRQRGRP
jgi:hypothetical protein